MINYDEAKQRDLSLPENKNLCLCHKQSGKEEVQGKVDKYMLTWWKYWGCNFKKSRKEIPDDEKKDYVHYQLDKLS